MELDKLNEFDELLLSNDNKNKSLKCTTIINKSTNLQNQEWEWSEWIDQNNNLLNFWGGEKKRRKINRNLINDIDEEEFTWSDNQK